ncbi:hypothetical protein GCM10008171_32920 [Methylopila jiangsuensis]|uniref:Uncharacterized protein n=1 Tax=Methylopila jiangsuensis TaxID=586230 RepID=A0A9W6JM61_9HYPH|nr:hypothetical protein [Methylopila jiangsuensis]MDR6284573.1 hypothetical protein [Methylopila jiangsuensis]GLK78038.1 hypothetical protein GCM10008171_32920 [Methylopila jiangsuensis]
MPTYTNTTRQSLDFVTGGTPDKPEITSFRAGETKEASLNADHPSVVGALQAGALVEVVETAPEIPNVRRAKADLVPQS